MKVSEYIPVEFIRFTERILFLFLFLEEQRPITPGPPTGAVIGGIIGALVFFGVIAGIVFLICKYQVDAE